MKRFYVVLLILISGNIFSQKLIPIKDFEFTNFKADTLIFDRDSSLLIPFFAKYDSVLQLKTGNIKILHIGGSHVQAGSMSHQIRRNLLNNCSKPYASRGIIFPYPVAKTNNPSDYKISYKGKWTTIRNVYKNISKPLGILGIAVSTQDSLAEITIKMNDSKYSFLTDKIYLFGFSDSGEVVPSIRIDSTDYLPVTIDVDLRRYLYDIPPTTDSFVIKINNTDSTQMFTLTGIYLENSLHGITFNSIGINGASVPSYLNCDYFEQDMALIDPDLVIFGIGINDASTDKFLPQEFESNYQKLIDKIKNINPNCAFIFITNNDSYRKIGKKYSVNQNGPIAQKVFYSLAKKNKGAVWDQFAIMGGLKSMYQWQLAKLAQRDKIHFTLAGYRLMGDLFYNAIILSYLQYKQNL